MAPKLRAHAVLVFVCIALAAPAQAAEVTRVATAAEKDNPIDLDLAVGFARTQRRGKITRERHQPDGSGVGHVADVIELRYSEVTQQMPLKLTIGIFHDLELHVGASMVFNDNKSWGYPGLSENGQPVTNDSNSTIRNNCINPDGTAIAGCLGDSFNNAQAIFPVPGQSFRAGLSNITMGIAWAPMNDKKDDTKPKWVVGFDYTMPTADVDKPWLATSESKNGPIGDKTHRYGMWTALSKRLGAVDPYLKLAYTFPVIAPNYVSNCDNRDAQGFLGYPQNCYAGPWNKKETGLKPQHVGGITFGAEFYAYDEPEKQQRVGFDFQFSGQYVSEGRTYNELSDALGKILYSEEYLTVGGSFGVYARAAEYVQLKLNASLYHDTEHWLTNEPVGKDLDGACKGISGTTCVDLDNHSSEINPNFDFRYDMIGRRFRISEVNVFTIMATGTVSF